MDLASQETVVAPVKPENWGEPAEQEDDEKSEEPIKTLAESVEEEGLGTWVRN